MHEEGLINGLKEKEQKAFEQLIDHYKPIVERFLFQYGVHPTYIPDNVKNIFVKFTRKVDRLEEGNLSTSFYQIMIHTLKDYDDRQKKAQKLGKNQYDPSVYGYYFEKQDHIKIQGKIGEIPRKYRVPLILKQFHNKKMEEISAILKLNEEKLNKMVQHAESLVGKTLSINQGNSLHESLDEMKYIYNRLSDLTDKQEILMSMELTRKTPYWKKRLPTFAAVIGLLLFALFAVNYIQEQKHELEKQAKQEEKQAAQEASKDAMAPAEPEKRELDPEIAEYLERKIESFALELGMEDVSNFPIVISARATIEELKRNPDMFGNNVDDTKNYIDSMLTLPSVRLEILESPSKAGPYSFIESLGVFSMYEMEFQDYLQWLMIYPSEKDYDTIVEFQDHPEHYNGREELKELLNVLNEQGYLIMKDDDGYLSVKVDYDELKDRLMKKGYGEAYLSYVDYYAKQSDIDWSNWQEMDTLLLEIESLLIQYKESYHDEFLDYIVSDMTHYLHQYLRLWEGNITVSEEEKEEYLQFLVNHPDSIYSTVISNMLTEWEENEWRRSEDFSSTEKIRFQLDDRYKNIHYEDIVEIAQWPWIPTTGSIFQDYSSNLDTNLLIELNPIETVALFSYAYGNGDRDTYSTLLVNSEMEVSEDLTKMAEIGGFGLTEYTSDNKALIYFVDWGGSRVAEVELVNENGIWKIIR